MAVLAQRLAVGPATSGGNSDDTASGDGNADIWFDNGFVVQVSDGYVPDLGAYGAGTHEPASDAKPKTEAAKP